MVSSAGPFAISMFMEVEDGVIRYPDTDEPPPEEEPESVMVTV